MYYIFLWTLIERFTFLTYGLGANPNKRNLELANDLDLKECFSRLLLEPNFNYLNKGFERFITKSDKPSEKITWRYEEKSENDCKKMINFYYALRSNITHRGKSGLKKHELLDESFKELLFIFENMWKIKKEKSLLTKKRIDNLIRTNEQAY